MMLMLDDHLRRTNRRSQADLGLVTPEAYPETVAGLPMGDSMVGLLESRGIAPAGPQPAYSGWIPRAGSSFWITTPLRRPTCFSGYGPTGDPGS